MNRTRFNLVFSLLLPVMLFAGPDAWAASDDAMADRLQACEACHGRAAQSAQDEIYYPPIGGKPTEYLFQQLLNFKEGRRANPTMKHLLAYLSPEYLHEIAAWYAQQEPVRSGAVPERHALDPASAARGEQLVQLGEGADPACTDCHGGDLSGDGVAIPGLRGLSVDYIKAQLGAWQAGTRRAREPDCMAEVARSLSGSDVEIVARWIASAQDADMVEGAVDTTALPQECGAVQ